MMKIVYCLLAVFILVSCSDNDSDTFERFSYLGSMARLAVNDDILYAVTPRGGLKVFNISDAANPKIVSSNVFIGGFGIETIYPIDTLLFIGSFSGMYMFDISEPKLPVQLSKLTIFKSCDPVAVQGVYAYVTHNSSLSNALSIYDISNPLVPVLKQTKGLYYPMGLGIDGEKLFVCDRGLSVFNISDPVNISQIEYLVNINEDNISTAYDVIPADGLLILVTEEGLFQFDYTGEKLKFVSKITHKQEIP
jgi:hypothetical protein